MPNLKLGSAIQDGSKEALILLDVQEDKDELDEYSKKWETRTWMRKGSEKRCFNNIFAEFSVEDTDS